MAVKIKRSTTASSVPPSLVTGEIAINEADGKLYYRASTGTVTQFGPALFAALSHSHAASDITSGTLDIARIPTGSTSSTVCIGNDSRLSNARTPTSHVLATTSGLGGEHSVSGLTSGMVLMATGATTAAFQGIDAGNIASGSLAILRGGTSATDAATARSNLGAAPTASPAFTGAATFAGSVQLNITNAPLDSAGNLRVFTTDTQAADKGGQIGLGGQNGSAGSFDPWSFAVIKGAKENSTSGNLAGYVVFATANSGGVLGERLRISSTGTATFAGQVRVNTADSSTALLVNGATRGVRFNTSTDGTRIEGVDNTGVGSYQPLILNGSTVTIQSNGGTSAITVGTSQTATFAGQILADDLATSNSVVYGFDGDTNTGVGRAGADILTVVTGGSERVRVNSAGDVSISGANVSGGLRYLDIVNTSSTASSGSIIRLITRNSANTADTSVDFLKYNNGDTVMVNRDSGSLTFATDSTNRLIISGTGTLTAIDTYSTVVGATNRDLFIDSTGLIGYVSSIRESKTDIVTLDDVSWLSALSPVSYRYRKRNADGTYSDEADGVTDYGLIAEDVEAVRPELCFYDQVDGEPQLRGVTYSKLITPMLRYIQQLEQRIAALEERING